MADSDAPHELWIDDGRPVERRSARRLRSDEAADELENRKKSAPPHTADHRAAAPAHHRHRAPKAEQETADVPFWPFREPAETNDVMQPGRIRRPLTATGEPPSGHRRPIRSLVIGGALAAVILGGAGVAAWAMASTPPPVSGVSGVSGQGSGVSGQGSGAGTATGNGSVGGNQSGAPATTTQPSPAAASAPAVDGANASNQPSTPPTRAAAPGVLTPAAPAGGADQPAPNAPATVSTLAPGDTGFGWPSSAFGSVPTP